jgi:hypothetical protein
LLVEILLCSQMKINAIRWVSTCCIGSKRRGQNEATTYSSLETIDATLLEIY